MTMPHLSNCPHSFDGWCLDCVREQSDALEAYKKHWVNVVCSLTAIEREAERISDIMDEGDHWETAYDRLQCFINERVAKATGGTP